MDNKSSFIASLQNEESGAGGNAISSLTERVRSVAEVAKSHATDVDAASRFPQEAFEELRRQRLLGVMVPASLKGEGATLSAVVDACYTLGQSCSSTALIYAMHQVKVACISRHGSGSVFIENILRRIATEQLLMASSTTEGKSGGDVRSSEAAVVHDGEHISLERKATVISYARHADGIVTTARRSVTGPASDQVLLVLLKSDYQLERSNMWDSLGMRGTLSEGFTLRARASAAQILPDRYDKIHASTMVPYAHLLWGAVWAGIAAAAVSRAQAFTRLAARQSGGKLPPGAGQLTHAISSLNTLRALLATALRRYEAAGSDENLILSLEFQSMLTLTKVQASELAVSVVFGCLRASGLTGYRNDSEFSIGRLLRDVLSAPLMINNERILANLATASLMQPLPSSIAG